MVYLYYHFFVARNLLVITAIILGNLFAFLIVGHILDSLLNNDISMKLVFVCISVIPLIIAMFIYIRKTQTELTKISNNEEN